MKLTPTLLLFSTIAFSQGNPRYLAKPIDKRGPMFCSTIYDGSYFSLGYTVVQKQIAIKAHNILPFHYRFTKYNTEVEYRTPYNGNRYLDIQINRMHGIRIFSYNNELWTSAGYKRIKSHHTKITEQFFLGPRLDRNRMFNITIAYARQQQQNAEGSTQKSNGLMLSLYKDFHDQLIINTSVTYWFDEWQYAVRLRKQIRNHGIFVGLGWERVGDWWEGGWRLW